MAIYASSIATRNAGASTGSIEVELGDPLHAPARDPFDFDVDVVVTILEGGYAYESSDYPANKIVGTGPRTRQFKDVQFASGQTKTFRYNWKNGTATCDYVVALWGKETKTGTPEKTLLHFHWGRIPGSAQAILLQPNPNPFAGVWIDRDLLIVDELRKLREALEPPGLGPPLPEKPPRGSTRGDRPR